jgi:high frequency lysogenization protein
VREGRVIALAGLFQALALVRALATRGSCDPAAARHSITSVFRIDADSPADVFGGIGNLRLGLETLVAQLGETGRRDLVLTRMAVQVLRLQRALARRQEVLRTVRTGINALQGIAVQVESGQVDASARLAELYAQTLSRLQPRILVEGNPTYLQQAAQVNQIRTLLLAAVRAAVLWRQLGGSQLRLVFRRRQYTMLARGFLARCTLNGT